jgi:uncharacterized membrane protein
MAQWTLDKVDRFFLWFFLVMGMILALLVLADKAKADCRHFFVQKQVVVPVYQQVVYPAVAVSPYIYQAGRDIEADALAEKVARLVAQKLTAASVQQQQKEAPKSALVQHCSSCHAVAAPPKGVLIDGTTQMLSSQITSSLRAIRDEKMPKDHKVPPEVKAALMEELLSLERKEELP